MSGKAPHKRDIIDVIKAQQKITKIAAGVSRAIASGVIDASSGVLSGPKNQASGAGSINLNAGHDLNMHTYDIVDVDRLKFSVTKGSGDQLLTTDTGIESNSYFDPSNDTYYSVGMRLQIPTNQAFLFAVGGGSDFIIYDGLVVASAQLQCHNCRLDPTTLPSVDVPTSAGSIYYDGTDVKAIIPTGTVNLTSGAGGANTTLSNLTSPTSINQDLIPSTGFKDLGSSNTAWDYGYIFNGRFNNIEIDGTGTPAPVLDMKNHDIKNVSDLYFDGSESIYVTESNGSFNEVMKFYNESQDNKIVITTNSTGQQVTIGDNKLELVGTFIQFSDGSTSSPPTGAPDGWFYVYNSSGTIKKIGYWDP